MTSKERAAGLPAIQPLATMEEAWAESVRLAAESVRLWAEGERLWAEGERLRAEGERLRAEGERLWAEGNRLRAESELIVILTAQALHGKKAQIDWVTHEVHPFTQEEEKP